MSSLDRFDAWYATRPLWIRAPLAAAAVAIAFGVFSILNARLSTLQDPVMPWSAGVRSTLWFGLAGAAGGLAYALTWPRLSPRGLGGRLSAGALTVLGAFVPTVLLLILRADAEALSAPWFWLSLLGFTLVGAIVIGRPWRQSRP